MENFIKQKFNFYDDKQSISKTTKHLVQSMLMDRVSMKYIAKELNIDKKTVINILDEMPDPNRLPLPSVICLDEFHFSNANSKAGKYPCVISNPFNTELIDIIESRRKAYLLEYFQKISFKERSNVKYYISDMNEIVNNKNYEAYVADEIDSDKKNEDRKHLVSNLLDCLSERERDIIEMYFGINCNQINLEEIGEVYGITRERTRQIIEAAFKKVRSKAILIDEPIYF